MASNSYTTTNLVSNVQLVGHIPLSNSTFTSSEIINLANRELQTAILSQIFSAREGYYLTYQDYDVNATGKFVIPSQAIGGALDCIQVVNEPNVIPVNRIEHSEQFSTLAPNATTYSYFMVANTVNIIPNPTFGVVRLWYIRRPNALIPVTGAASISNIAGNVLTVASVPSTMTIGTKINICQDQPPFDVLTEGVITNIAGTDVTLDLVSSTTSIGDWLCLADQTPVPQIPVEFRPLLEQRVVVKIYELQGYIEKMKAAGEMLKRMEQDTFRLIDPRVETQTKIINPQNGGFTKPNTRNASLYWSRR
jgi:hypothetical protein